MHARHRSPGSRYRSNSTGMGLGASRMSPDISARGHGFYNSDRSFNNRGFGRGRGRGQFKSFQQPPQPPPRKGDIWMEAGRLAAEYLVSKGMLPQSALSGKWQGGNLKKQVEDYPDFRQQEDFTQDGRMPAHSRSGSGATDTGLSRKRYNDEFGTKNYVKGRRRGEYYQRHSGSEWGREYGRFASFSDKNRLSPDIEGEDDISSRHYDQPKIGNDFGDATQKSVSSDLAPEREAAADMGSVQEKYNYMDKMGSEAISSSDGQEENTEGLFNISDDLPDAGDIVKGSSNSYETEKQINTEQLPIQRNLVDDDHPGKKGSDLLTLCKFANMPTKTRSALTSRVPKADQFRIIEGDNASDTGNLKGSEVLVEDFDDDTSRDDNVLANTVHDSKCPGSVIAEVVEPSQPVKDVVETDTAFSAGQRECLRSQSFPDRVFMHENEKESSGLLFFGRSSSVKELGEKRPTEFSDLNEEPKKQREWLPSLVTGTGDHLTLSGFSENIASSHDARASSGKPDILLASDDNYLGNCQFPKIGGETSVKFAEEKQFLPNSFKICDLNLAESSDTTDNHHNGPVGMYHSTMTTEKAGTMVDIDFSMSNANMTSEYSGQAADGKGIEIIDLDNDSTLEEKVFENSRQRMETTFPGTEGFSSQVQNTTDVQIDNLMLSEFVTSFSNCNSVSDDINPLQNEMGLHNGEATLGDDDSIYMSLGEIPLSFIPDWEQPTAQEYEKPF